MPREVRRAVVADARKALQRRRKRGGARARRATDLERRFAGLPRARAHVHPDAGARDSAWSRGRARGELTLSHRFARQCRQLRASLVRSPASGVALPTDARARAAGSLNRKRKLRVAGGSLARQTVAPCQWSKSCDSPYVVSHRKSPTKCDARAFLRATGIRSIWKSRAAPARAAVASSPSSPARISGCCSPFARQRRRKPHGSGSGVHSCRALRGVCGSGLSRRAAHAAARLRSARVRQSRERVVRAPRRVPPRRR